MRGKIVFMALSVMMAVSTGFSHDISGYAYEAPVYQAYMEEESDTVEGETMLLPAAGEVELQHIEKAMGETQAAISELEEARRKAEEEAARQAAEEACRAEEQAALSYTAQSGVSSSERDILARIVMAEAGSEDIQGQIMVANVILNRIAAGYGSSVSDIVFAPGQFEPVSSGTFWSVSPSASAYEAADRALAGEDYSAGALYFVSPYGDCSWFMEALTLVTQHGGHLFFR